MASSRIEVDLRAVDHNLRVIRQVVSPASVPSADAPGAEIVRPPAHASRQPVSVCAVIKQDGYSLGAVRLAKRIASAAGPGATPPVEMLAVYGLDEVRELAEANITTPVLVLRPVREMERTDPTYRSAAAGRLHLTIHDVDQLSHLERLCTRLGFVIPVHVFVDTGIGRGGALPEEATQIVQRIVRGGTGGPRIRLAGMMTHFASPCEDAAFTREQATVFRDWVTAVKPMLPGGAGGGAGLAVHAANTCATFRSDKYHGTMVRVGQSLYGYGLEGGACESEQFSHAAAAKSLKAAVRWVAPIVHIKEIPAGFPVGYGSTWHAPTRPDGKKTKIALVPAGYADGYPRSLSNVGMAGLTGRPFERRVSADEAPAPCTGYAPVVGRISMDQITLDVTDMPGSSVFVGGEAELAGVERAAPNYLPTLAASAGTITHELLCRISARIERVHKYPMHAAGAGVGGMGAGVSGGAAAAGAAARTMIAGTR